METRIEDRGNRLFIAIDKSMWEEMLMLAAEARFARIEGYKKPDASPYWESWNIGNCKGNLEAVIGTTGYVSRC